MKIIKEKFGIKVSVALTVFIFIISFSFTAFYIHDQRKSLTDTLITNGKLLAGILSDTSRIGVFSENETLLKDPVEGVFHQKEVLEVSIFNLDGNVLIARKRPEMREQENPLVNGRKPDKSILEIIKMERLPVEIEVNDHMEFWSPVMSNSGFSGEESLIFDEESNRKRNRIIGFVRITFVKEILRRHLHILLFKSILMGIVFLIMGCGITYLVVNGITKPLNRLTEGVRALGAGGDVDQVPVETEDEIGKLALAFNNMSESLKIREQALTESEKRLRFLSTRLIEVQEQERRRISKGLHDELGQTLALLKHRLRGIQRQLPEKQDRLREECHSVNRYLDQIIENVRRLSKDLSPSILEDLGLSAALAWMIENFGTQYSIRTSVELANIDPLFSINTRTNLYRIFQEALTNIGKHARATHVSFCVKEEKKILLFIMNDDGKGFDVNEAMAKNAAERGMGLTAINERAHMMGAELEITSRKGKGTAITLKIPV